MGIRVLLLEDDASYAARLMDYMNEYSDYAFQVITFTEPQKAVTYCKTERVDALLLNRIFSEVLEDIPIQMPLFFLSEEKPSESDDHVFYKYQSSKVLCKAIHSHFAPENKAAASGQTQFMGFLTFEDPCAAENLMCELAKTLAVNKKVLMLMLHPLFPAEKGETGYAVSELFYLIKKQEGLTILQLKKLIREIKGVDFLAGYANWADACDAEEEDMTCLCKELSESRLYDLILVEAGGLYPYTRALLEKCHAVFYVESKTGGKAGSSYYESFLRQLRFGGGQCKTENFYKITDDWDTEKLMLQRSIDAGTSGDV